LGKIKRFHSRISLKRPGAIAHEPVIGDSGIFISLFENLPGTIDGLSKIRAANVLMTSISAMGLFRGKENKKEMALMENRIKRYNIVHPDEAVSKKAPELINKYRLSHNLQMPGALVAAMSIVYGLPLSTHNRKDLRFVPGIKLY
jgi:predicted nucleic acid-binding protein